MVAWLKITQIVVWWGNPCLMIFGLFSMLFYVKWRLESDFLLTFDCYTKLRELWQFFRKKLTIENNMNGDVVRESPPYDFLIIFNATSCKMIRRIRFSIYFWPPDKIDGIMADYVNFSNKKTAIILSILTGGQK